MPNRPPGFDVTPEHLSAFVRKPEAVVVPEATPERLSAFAQTSIMADHVILGHLFEPLQLTLLPSPESSPPKAPTHRRKTLVDVHISTTGWGLSLRRNSPRVTARGASVAAAMAKEAQGLLCRTIGIFKNGQDVIEWALDKFEKQFKEQMPETVLAALRGMFKIDDAQAIVVEEALINHGGDTALDHEDAVATPSV
ncbi:hypothetical protein ZWY2020_028081 [Hordeum vulgare]|nr:hypothetical protein ZWY2020_028081 [Hordeum vulgare]